MLNPMCFQQHGGERQHHALRRARDEHPEHGGQERGRIGAARQLRGGAVRLVPSLFGGAVVDLVGALGFSLSGGGAMCVWHRPGV